MKPLRLELRGFTAFREPAVVEFEGRRLFVITGPTGAGKSSLLDAMVWALYAHVPRVGRSTHQLVTHGEKSMSVRFDFEAQGRTYRVSRHAPGSVGARLEQLTDAGEWRPLADRAREVTAEVTRLLGLDYSTFIRTIVLPQGAFDAFLRGDEKDRRAILTRLLGLDIYEQAGRSARAKARSASELGEALSAQVERLALSTPQAICALDEEQARLERELGGVEARRERLAALAELARVADDAAAASKQARGHSTHAANALRDAEQAAAAAEQGLAEATSGAERLAAERAALGYDPAEHERLRALAAIATQRDEARAALDGASATHDAAEAATERARCVLDERGTESAAAAAALQAAAVELAAEAGRAAAMAEALSGAAAEAREGAASAAGEHQLLERRAHVLEGLVARASRLEQDHLTAEAARAGAQDALAGAEADRESGLAALESAEGAAQARREAMEAARAQEAAAALQRRLQPGDRCPVCGEAVQQLPLTPASGLGEAADALAQAERVLQAARASDGESTAAAAREAAAVDHTREAFEGLARQLVALDAELATADAGRDDVGAAVEQAQAGAAAAHERASALERRAQAAAEGERALSLLLARLPATVEPQRGDSDSVEANAGVEAPRALEGALDAHWECESVAKRTAEVATAAERASSEAAASLEHHRAERERATEAVAAIDRRWTVALGNGVADVEQFTEVLAAAGAKASRAQALDDGMREAETARAASGVRVEERRRDHERAGAQAAEGERDAARADECASDARATLSRAWSECDADAPAGEAPERAVIVQLLVAAEAAAREGAQALGAVRERVERARREAAEATLVRSQIDDLGRTAAVAGALEQELKGDRFIAYVQQEALELLAAEASQRLLQLSSRRYRLALDEKGEFVVVDGNNGDERRSVKTLSGGETFLASLALSLALSERLPQLAGIGGAVALEALFLDEGFGSLDAQALDVAIDGLEALAGKDRLVGVISHVPQLAERLEDRIEVVPIDGTSIVRG